MGVVYKLKQDVINFIVGEKNNNPDVSCRQLVSVVESKFQIPLSKSSINAVIKQAQLSSSVGRRIKNGKKTQKFKIPEQRKAQIFGSQEVLPDIKAKPAFAPAVSATPAAAEKPKEEKPVLESPPPPEMLEQKTPVAADLDHPQKSTAPLPESKEQPLEKKPAESSQKKSDLRPLEGKFPQPQEKKTEEQALREKPPVPLMEKTEKEPPKQKPLEEKPAQQKSPEQQPPQLPQKAVEAHPVFLNLTAARQSPELKKQQGIFCDGMGCFFLKAAEWELSNSSILGNLLSKYSQGYLTGDINGISESLLYLWAFGIKTLDEISQYDKTGLWELNGLSQRISQEVFVKLTQNIRNVKNLASAMANEYTQIFSEISYIKITLADKTEMCIDGRFMTVWNEDNVRPYFSVPLNKILSDLSLYIISNIQSAIIANVPGAKGFARYFYDMAFAFENLADKSITKIAICDSFKQEIAKFTVIPNKKRSFIIGSWPWQEECKRFLEEDPKLIKSYTDEDLECEIHYSELKTKLGLPGANQTIKIRVALLREAKEGSPVLGIITNIPEEAMATEDVISSYLMRWPNLKEGYKDFTTKIEVASQEYLSLSSNAGKISRLDGGGCYNFLQGSVDVWTNIKFLLAALNSYCQRHFFPPGYEKLDFATMKERVYGLCGYLAKGKKILKIALVIPPSCGYQKDLEYAIRRINESNLCDTAGRLLRLKISQ